MQVNVWRRCTLLAILDAQTFCNLFQTATQEAGNSEDSHQGPVGETTRQSDQNLPVEPPATHSTSSAGAHSLPQSQPSGTANQLPPVSYNVVLLFVLL
jgi:hypothetical protein